MVFFSFAINRFFRGVCRGRYELVLFSLHFSLEVVLFELLLSDFILGAW